MGQNWRIINIDRQEFADSAKLGEFFNDGYTNRRVGRSLRTLRTLPPMPWLAVDGREKYAHRRDNCATLLRLPPELLSRISMHVATLSDSISLAATCHLLWTAGAPILAEWGASTTWSGCRLICIGDGTNDLPADLLSDAERAQLTECGTHHEHSIFHNGDSREKYKPATLSQYVAKHYWDYTDVPKLLRNIINKFMLPAAPRRAIEQMRLVHGPRSGELLVLRNLSKKLYVRSGAMDVLNEQLFAQDAADPNIDGPARVPWTCDILGFYNAPYVEDPEPGYCLGDALMCRICWSSDPSCSMWEPPADLTRGPWAGDRFDLIEQEEFDIKADYDEWRDASEAVCDVLRLLWRK